MSLSHYAVCIYYAVELYLEKKRKEFGKVFVGLLENDRYPNGIPHWGSFFGTQ